MNKRLLLVLLPIFWISSCSNSDKGSVESWKGEILQAESDFSAMSEKDGMQAAFLYFAAEDVVIDRNDELLVGKPALKEYLESQPEGARDELLTWTADFADVSKSGDLGYTYGYYSMTLKADSSIQTGTYLSIWKKQPEGTWKFVLDTGNEGLE